MYIGGQDSLGSTSSSAVTSSGGAVSKAKLDDSWKKSGRAAAIENLKPSNSRPPLLVAVLEVLDALLTSASSSLPMQESNDSSLSVKSTNTQALILRPIRRSSLFLKQGKSSKPLIDAGDRMILEDDTLSIISSTLIVELCHRLKNIWHGLVLDSSVVASHTVEVLILVSKLSYQIGKTFQSTNRNEYQSLVATMFSCFPHSSLDANLAAPGSAGERSGAYMYWCI